MPLKKERVRNSGTKKRRQSKNVKDGKEKTEKRQKKQREGMMVKGTSKQQRRKSGISKTGTERKGIYVMNDQGDQTEKNPQEGDKSQEKRSEKESQEQEESSKIDEALEFLNKEVKEKKDEINRLISEKYSNIKAVMVKGVLSSEFIEKMKHGWTDTVVTGEEKLKEMTTNIDKKVHESPWLYLGIAAAIGFLLGYASNKSKEGPEENTERRDYGE